MNIFHRLIAWYRNWRNPVRMTLAEANRIHNAVLRQMMDNASGLPGVMRGRNPEFVSHLDQLSREEVFRMIKHPEHSDRYSVAMAMGHYLRGMIPPELSVVDVGMKRMKEWASQAESHVELDLLIAEFTDELQRRRTEAGFVPVSYYDGKPCTETEIGNIVMPVRFFEDEKDADKA